VQPGWPQPQPPLLPAARLPELAAFAQASLQNRCPLRWTVPS